MGKIINNDYTFLNYALALFFLASPIESIALSEGFSIGLHRDLRLNSH